jgi:hypothetical protein
MATLTLTQAAGGHDAGSTIETSDGAAATLVALGYARHTEAADKPKRGRAARSEHGSGSEETTAVVNAKMPQ